MDLEYWNFVVKGCKGRFIRRSYLCSHLHKIHGFNRVEAREKALMATKGNRNEDEALQDVSDNESIFELLQERENVSVEEVVICSERQEPENVYSDKSDCETEKEVSNLDQDVRVVTQRYFICLEKKYFYRGDNITGTTDYFCSDCYTTNY